MKEFNFHVINIDKPVGPTSFSISEYVRKSLNLKKTSHMGTLDPKVSGVLPITLNRACRLAPYLISREKKYIGVLLTHKPQKLEELQKIINERFVGEIVQTPPHKSSVKRVPRKRRVYFFNILESQNDKYFLFETKVQGGTYIRKICSDLGELIGGAHMVELRRTQAGIFDEKNLFTLYEFDKAVSELKNNKLDPINKMVIPAQEIIKRIFPLVYVHKRAVRSLLNGKPLNKSDVLGSFLEKTEFAAFSGERFIGIYQPTNEPKFAGRPKFVFNNPPS